MTEAIEATARPTALARRQTSTIAQADEMSVEEVLAQVQKIQEVMAKAMHEGEHFGVIPGTDKPTLFKAGAEKLLLTFRLGPRYRTEKTFHDDEHLTVTAICALEHIPTGNFVAEGEGMCSTKEAKYAYRNAQRVCPSCGVAAIIKGKKEYGGGWVCFKKKDGCGAKFDDNDPTIVSQQVGRTDNPDLADSYNTVLKMACKRALIAACLNGTAASDLFTQDLEVEEVAKPAPWYMQAVFEYGERRVIEVCDSLRTGEMRITSLEQVEGATPERQRQVMEALAANDWGASESVAQEGSTPEAQAEDGNTEPKVEGESPRSAAQPSQPEQQDLGGGNGIPSESGALPGPPSETSSNGDAVGTRERNAALIAQAVEGEISLGAHRARARESYVLTRATTVATQDKLKRPESFDDFIQNGDPAILQRLVDEWELEAKIGEMV